MAEGAEDALFQCEPCAQVAGVEQYELDRDGFCECTVGPFAAIHAAHAAAANQPHQSIGTEALADNVGYSPHRERDRRRH